MALYSYKVKDRAGRTRTGTLEAENERVAAAMIRDAGGFPMEIRPVYSRHGVSQEKFAGSAIVRHIIHPFWTGVNMRSLVFFYRQLSTMLAAGMSLSETLRSISQRSRGSLRRISGMAQARVQGGGCLSDEMSRHPRVFAPLQVSLIRAGERSGLIEPMAERIASYLEFEMSIRRKIVMATFYPFLILLVIFLMPVLMTWVLHSAQDAVLTLWSQFRSIGIPIIIVMAACKFLFQFGTVRFIWDIVKIQPPVLGTMARKIAMSRFSRSLALLYSSGIPIGQSVSISAEACANVAIGSSIERMIPAINNGQPLTKSLEESGVMLPVVLDMLYVGEKTGSYDETLRKVADYMDDEAKTTLNKLPYVLFVLMMLLAGILTLFAVLGGYSAYIDEATGSGL